MPSICELPQGSAPGKYGPCPIQTTSPEWSVPCTPARTRRSTIYHSIYINSLINSSVVPSFLIRSPCFSSPRLLPWLPIGSVLSVSQSPEPQRLHLVPEAPRDRKKLPVVPNYPFHSIRPPRLNRPFSTTSTALTAIKRLAFVLQSLLRRPLAIPISILSFISRFLSSGPFGLHVFSSSHVCSSFSWALALRSIRPEPSPVYSLRRSASWIAPVLCLLGRARRTALSRPQIPGGFSFCSPVVLVVVSA